MKLGCCEHPVRVVDRISGEVRYVPCGKCDSCRGARSAGWCERIAKEMFCHKYNLFVTLTYNDDFVPRLYRDGNMLVDDVYGLGLDLADIGYYDWPQKDRDFVDNAPFFNYCRIKDLQGFIKRLRRYIDFFVFDENEDTKIRYFACSEMGETYLRPHFHIVFFFDSDILSEKIGELLSKAWTLEDKSIGELKYEYIKSATFTYVARYVNSIGHLPKVFQCKELRPKSVCSKRPFIGFNALSDEERKELVYSQTPYLRGQRKNDAGIYEACNVPLWRSFEDYLWPKISGYCRISDSLRVDLYKLPFVFPCEKSEEFVDKVAVWSRDYASCNSVAFYIHKLLDLPDDFIDKVDAGFEHVNSHAVETYYYCGLRVAKLAAHYGVSFDCYLRWLFQYYAQSKPSWQLSEWFRLCEEYSLRRSDELRDMIMLDATIFERVRSLSYDIAKLRYGLLVGSYGIDFDEFYFYGTTNSRSLSVYNITEVRDFISLSHKIAESSRKTKRKNDYMRFRRHPSETIAYYQVIDTFYNSVY